MPNHEQGQKNVDDSNKAWAQFQDFLDKHLPASTVHLYNVSYRVGTKGSLWP